MSAPQLPQFSALLPSPRQLVTSIITSISSSHLSASPPPQPFKDSQPIKDLFLSLHVIFPNELLPALDLLDRGLVTRHRLAPSPPERQSSSEPNQDEEAQPSQPLRQHGRLKARSHVRDLRHQHRDERQLQLPGTSVPDGVGLARGNSDALQAALPSHVEQDENPPQPTSIKVSHPDFHDGQMAAVQALGQRPGVTDTGAAVTPAAARDSGLHEAMLPAANPQLHHPPVTYYVRSAQLQNARGGSSSRYRSTANVDSTAHYEVRLHAWSCSCPAFAFSAFPATTISNPDTNTTLPPTHNGFSNRFRDDGRLFGGLTRGEATPICKHLLACVLVEHCSVFSDMVDEREVSLDEFAGWAVGWGD